MSLIRRAKTRITAKQVGKILGFSHRTVLNGGALPHVLTKICNSTRQVQKTHHQPQTGFSLIELLIVVAIIGIIAEIRGSEFVGISARPRISPLFSESHL